jgi:hypothetical protein
MPSEVARIQTAHLFTLPFRLLPTCVVSVQAFGVQKFLALDATAPAIADGFLYPSWTLLDDKHDRRHMVSGYIALRLVIPVRDLH